MAKKYTAMSNAEVGAMADKTLGTKTIKAKGKKHKIKTSGTYKGKSNAIGQGGRAQQLKDQGVPGGVIGNLARAAQAAPGQKNYH